MFHKLNKAPADNAGAFFIGLEFMWNYLGAGSASKSSAVRAARSKK